MHPLIALLRRSALKSSVSPLSLRSEADLRKYQRHTVDLISRTLEPDGPPGVIMALEPGAGKTVSTLTAIRKLLDARKIKKVLIVAPLLVAETVWHAEIAQWLHTQNITYSIITGDAKRREARAAEPTEVHIINRENVPWLWEHFGKGKLWPYDFLVIDEASMLKNGKKRTAKHKLTRFGALAQARKHFKSVVELTGTPAPNGLVNLWGLAYIIDQGERLGRTREAFMDRWFEQNQYTYEVKPKPGAEKEIMDRIKDIMFSLDPKDYVELPPLVENNIKVVLPPKVMAEYRRFKRTLVSEMYDVEAVNSAVLTNKLLQFCVAKDTEVLTDSGWKKIQHVDRKDKVWDGVEWVSCKGNICNGVKTVVSCFGVDMTPDHKVLTNTGWREAQEIIYGESSTGLDRKEVRLPDGFVETRDHGRSDKESHLDVRMPMWKQGDPHQSKLKACRKAQAERNAELRLYARGNSSSGSRRARDDWRAALGDLVRHESQMSKSELQGLAKLRWTRHRHARPLVFGPQFLLVGNARRACGHSDTGQARQLKGLLQRKLPMGVCENSDAKHSRERARGHALGSHHDCRGSREIGSQLQHSVYEAQERQAWRRTSSPTKGLSSERHRNRTQAEVYDLIDCGPRNRFVVRGRDGLVIVHNCNGSLIDNDGIVKWVHDCKLDALESLHDEVNGTPMLVAYSYIFDKDRIRKRFPKAVVLNEVKNVMDTVKSWNDGAIDMLLAHPASAGHGLNLQKGSNISCWYGLTADLELWQQFNKRLWRSGQTAERVWQHRIIAQDTHDEEILPILDRKDAVQSMVLRATMIDLARV